MTRLVVIAGLPNTGKWAAMMAVAARDPELRTLHRDQVRVLFGRLIDEAHLTELMCAAAASLLTCGYGVVTAAQNLDPADREQWGRVARLTGARLDWIDTAAGGLDAALAA